MKTVLIVAGLSAVTVAVAACSSGGGSGTTSTNTFTTSNSGSSSTSAGGGAGGSGGNGNLFDAGKTTGSMGTGGAPPMIPIYASTDTDLYTLDPTDPALKLDHVGTFDCIGPSGSPNQQSTAMTDVAVDKSENIWGLTVFGVRQLTVQGTTVHCGTQIKMHIPDPTSTDPNTPWIRFYALAFAPEGTVSSSEVLIAGDTAGELWAIDTANQTYTQHGSFGTVPANDGRGHNYPAANVGKPWELSGDIIFLANNGSPIGFATVRDCPNPPDTTGCSKIDTLIEIDMAALAQTGTQSVRKGVRGQVVRQATGCADTTNSGYGSMYGIAAWNDLVYGFSRTGNLVHINNDDGSACLVQDYSTSNINFSGAAVTTVAPVVAPPPPPVK